MQAVRQDCHAEGGDVPVTPQERRATEGTIRTLEKNIARWESRGSYAAAAGARKILERQKAKLRGV